MNVGPALGELQLRIYELEHRRGRSDDSPLREELEEAQRDAIRFGTQLSAAKAEIESLQQSVHQLRMAAKVAREQPAPVRKVSASSGEIALREENGALVARLRVTTADLDQAKRRIARLEAASQAVMDASGELSQAQEQIRRLEAEARGYAMQIADLRRQRDEANSLTGALEREVAALKERPAQPAECPTCAPIIRAIAQAVRAQETSTIVHRLSNMLPSEHTGPTVNNQTSSHAVRGIADGIRSALAGAAAPMITREIAAATGIDAKRIATNIPHLVHKGDVIRVGVPVHGDGHRYWLKSRALPQGVSA